MVSLGHMRCMRKEQVQPGPKTSKASIKIHKNGEQTERATEHAGHRGAHCGESAHHCVHLWGGTIRVKITEG